jgi:hypothetical protein
MATTPISIDDLQGKITQKVVLENISWQTYQAMLSEMGEHRLSRLMYDEGRWKLRCRRSYTKLSIDYWS